MGSSPRRRPGLNFGVDPQVRRYNAAVIQPPRLMCCLLTLALCAALIACTQQPQRPDLGRLYRVGSALQDTTPVIVIPGAFGSKLRHRNTGDEAWPGSARMLLFGDYREIVIDFDPETLQVISDNLEAFDIADAALGHDFYGQLLSTLQRFGGYVRSKPGDATRAGERRYYVYAYDWRQDNVESARGLDRLIDAIRRDYNDPTLKV